MILVSKSMQLRLMYIAGYFKIIVVQLRLRMFPNIDPGQNISISGIISSDPM